MNIVLPSCELAYPPTVWHFWVDDFPFPQVGYVSVPWRVVKKWILVGKAWTAWTAGFP